MLNTVFYSQLNDFQVFFTNSNEPDHDASNSLVSSNLSGAKGKSNDDADVDRFVKEFEVDASNLITEKDPKSKRATSRSFSSMLDGFQQRVASLVDADRDRSKSFDEIRLFDGLFLCMASCLCVN